MTDIALLIQINSWLTSAKDAARRGDCDAAWSHCNQAQHVINQARERAERTSEKK